MKLNRNQINKVKNALRNHNDDCEDDDCETTNTSIKDIKVALKKMESAENQQNNAKALKQAKKNARKSKRIEIKWNISVGDVVSFNLDGKEQLGLIIEDYSDGSFRSKREAKWRGKVLVMSPAGRQWFRPSALEKINEE